MLLYREIDRHFFEQYDQIPMRVHVTHELHLEKPDNGLGGLLLRKVPVPPYTKDLSRYEIASDYEKEFDISNWKFFMAFDGDRPVGGITLVSRTENVQMLDGRDDLCVLWDLRVHDDYKRRGIGEKLFYLGVQWATETGLKQIKIECQNNNVPACKFYKKQGAVLSAINEYAYYQDPAIRSEIQLIWYLDLANQQKVL